MFPSVGRHTFTIIFHLGKYGSTILGSVEKWLCHKLLMNTLAI
jgi:hypothetical protein